MASSDEVVNIIFKLTGNINSAIDSATSKISSMSDKVGNLSQKFAPLSGVAALALGGSIKLAADFDASMQTAARAMDLSGKSLDAFKSKILTLEKDLKYQFTSTELGNIAAGAAKLGVASNDLDKFTKSIAKIAVATDQAENIEELATNAAKIQTVFKMSVTQLDTFLNSVNRLDDATAANSNQLLNFVQRISGVAATSKISAEAITAWGATLISAGQAPNVAATFMNKFISVLGAATNMSPQAQTALNKLGYSASDLSKRFDKDANGTMLEFLNRVKQLDTVTQREVLGRVFGLEHVDTAQLIVQQTKELNQYLTASGESSKNAAKAQMEFNKAAESFKGISTAFKNQLAAIGVQIGTIILPVLVDFMKVLQPILQKVVELTQTQPSITKWIVGFLLVGAVIAPILGIIAALGSFIAFVAPVVTGIVSIVGAITAFIAANASAILMVTGFAMSVYRIYENWGGITGFFGRLWSGIVSYGRWAWNDLSNGAYMALVVITKGFNSLGDNAFIVVRNMITSFANFYNWLSGLGSNFFNMAINWGKGLIQGFINGIQSMYGSVTGVMNNFTNWLRQFLPSSDAERGGLSDLTASGKAFADTFMRGIENSGLDSRLNSAISAPSIPDSLRASAPGSIGGGQTQSINYSPVITITAKDSQDILKQLKAQEKQFLDFLAQASAKNFRTAY